MTKKRKQNQARANNLRYNITYQKTERASLISDIMHPNLGATSHNSILTSSLTTQHSGCTGTLDCDWSVLTMLINSLTVV